MDEVGWGGRAGQGEARASPMGALVEVEAVQQA